MNLLLLSSSCVGTTDYLSHAIPLIDDFLIKQSSPIRIIFIPFAGVTISFDEYEARVQKALIPLNIELVSIHHKSANDNSKPQVNTGSVLLNKQREQIKNADCILVGGGNTFSLLNELYSLELLSIIHDEVKAGKPYIGWSAGSNIAGASIKTTNDMPIVEPPSFDALNLLPCQLNPHYIEVNPSSHNGETRQQRIEEFLTLNPSSKVMAIPEGTALICNGESIYYTDGDQKKALAYLFTSKGKLPISTNRDISDLIKNSSILTG